MTVAAGGRAARRIEIAYLEHIRGHENDAALDRRGCGTTVGGCSELDHPPVQRRGNLQQFLYLRSAPKYMISPHFPKQFRAVVQSPHHSPELECA